MQGFEYSYTSSEKILQQMTHLSEFWVVELWILAGLVAFMVFLVFFGIPTVFTFKSSFLEGREKKKKKQMLHQIMIQKEIENQIEQEIQQEEEKKLQQTTI